MRFDLLTAQASSPKLEHSSGGESARYLAAVLYLSPHKLSGRNLCPNASPGCIAACLNLAGRGGIMVRGETSNPIQRARLARSKAFLADPVTFVDRLAADIRKLESAARKLGKIPAVRLNGTSDLPWERLKGSDGRTLFESFPGVRFYDYTKSVDRMFAFLDRYGWPENYSLTLSRSELEPDSTYRRILAMGGRVSVVYHGKDNAMERASDQVRFRLSPLAIVDGDATDFRFLDPAGSVNLLRAKGPAARDASGFVIRA